MRGGGGGGGEERKGEGEARARREGLYCIGPGGRALALPSTTTCIAVDCEHRNCSPPSQMQISKRARKAGQADLKPGSAGRRRRTSGLARPSWSLSQSSPAFYNWALPTRPTRLSPSHSVHIAPLAMLRCAVRRYQANVPYRRPCDP